MPTAPDITDPKLPALRIATDDGAMVETLRPLVPRAGGNGLIRPLLVRHRVLKHTPGKRCVVAYDLASADEPTAALRLIGKVYRGDRGERAFENLVHLWDLAELAGAGLGMAEPLAYVPSLGMVLQTTVPGVLLDTLENGSDWAGPLARAAENLARLHALPVKRGDPKSIADHLLKLCRPGPAALMAECHDLEPMIRTILERLDDGEDRRKLSCVVHGDLGLAQVFDDGARAFFVDFDGLCQSEPALDVANFLVSIEMRLGAAAAPLEQTFLARYASSAPEAALAPLDRYRALAYLRRAMNALRSRPSSGWRSRVDRFVRLADRAARGAASPVDEP